MRLFKACFLKTQQTDEIISYLNARICQNKAKGKSLSISVHHVSLAILWFKCRVITKPRKQTHEVISYLNARTSVLNINAFI